MKDATHRGDVRTDFQVLPHQSFKPSAIHLHSSSVKLAGGGRATIQLAKPPAWTEASDLPCQQEKPDGSPGYIEWDKGRASTARKCETLACPVIEECLAAVMEEEGDVGEKYRHGVRGGKTPEERAELGAAPRVVPFDRSTLTHCVNEHEYTEENTRMVTTKGSTHRQCLTCRASVARTPLTAEQREAANRRKRERRARGEKVA